MGKKSDRCHRTIKKQKLSRRKDVSINKKKAGHGRRR